MMIYEELKKDHKKVLSLLDQLVASEKSGPDTWSAPGAVDPRRAAPTRSRRRPFSPNSCATFEPPKDTTVGQRLTASTRSGGPRGAGLWKLSDAPRLEVGRP
ncbi:MAG: hypothetical protein IPF99_32255 [Deltaproteobacteria bacterium]|nr:hypothetical protein [Deltaproteobacteria bacterium]